MKNTFVLAVFVVGFSSALAVSTFGEETTNAPQTTASETKANSTKPGETIRSNLPVVKVLRTDPISSTVDGRAMSASLIEVTFAPETSSPPHYHPGEVVGYVAEGTLEFKIAGKPLKVLQAGDTFFEPTMIRHEVARNPDANKTCRIIVTMIHPKEAKRLTIPAHVVDDR